tara:strand:+ start:597 stop:1184 length:588 start_codon:yes stop_codon:yes gene_type:complete
MERMYMRSITKPALILLGLVFTGNSYAHDTGNCAQIESVLERLNCYDSNAKVDISQAIEELELAREAALQATAALTQAQADAEAQAQIQAQIETKAKADAEAANEQKVAAATSAKSSFFSRPEEFSAEFSATIKVVNKDKAKILVLLSNGQTWQIQKNHLVTFKVDDSVVVKQGLVGGYTMRVTGGGSYRVKQML